MSVRTRISLFILLLLGLHALPVLSYQGVRQTRWPFLVWAMYARSIPPGPIEVTLRTLYGATSNGRDQEVTPADVGLSGPAFRNAYLLPLANGDTGTARVLLDRINEHRTEPLVDLRLETIRHRLVDTGVVTEMPPAFHYPPVPQAGR